mgnify:CR=1 FL=1
MSREKRAVRKRLFIWLCCMGVCGAALLFGINAYIKHTTAKRILSVEEAAEKKADCILVLGCKVRPDGTPSLMLRDRLDKGLALYEAGASGRLLMSGDHGTRGYDEVNTMKTYALERGISSEVIFMDHAGFDTYDSMYRAKEIFCAERVLVVSQAYHLPRALYIAERLGLEAYGVAAEDIVYRGQSYRDLREAAARAKDFCQAWLKLKPKYLGEQIPIQGNGNLTND